MCADSDVKLKEVVEVSSSSCMHLTTAHYVEQFGEVFFDAAFESHAVALGSPRQQQFHNISQHSQPPAPSAPALLASAPRAHCKFLSCSYYGTPDNGGFCSVHAKMHLKEAQPAAAPNAAPSMPHSGFDAAERTAAPPITQTADRIKCKFESCTYYSAPEKKGYCSTHYKILLMPDSFGNESLASEGTVDRNVDLPVPAVAIIAVSETADILRAPSAPAADPHTLASEAAVEIAQGLFIQKPNSPSSAAEACAGVFIRGFSGKQKSMNGRYDLTSEENDGYPRYKRGNSVLASSVEWWIEFHAASHSWQIKQLHAKGMRTCEAFVPCFKADKSIASAQNGHWQVHIDSGEFRDEPLVQMDLL
jgi:hypothetical protein